MATDCLVHMDSTVWQDVGERWAGLQFDCLCKCEKHGSKQETHEMFGFRKPPRRRLHIEDFNMMPIGIQEQEGSCSRKSLAL